jgi:hypothetical protein
VFQYILRNTAEKFGYDYIFEHIKFSSKKQICMNQAKRRVYTFRRGL